MTAFKTTSMRIRGTSVEELEEAGLATDGLIESTAKLQSQIKALSGVDIMLDADTYKSTYQIMLEIAQVWDDLSDINQAALLEALAGKRNSQVLMSVIQNLDDLTGSYEAAQNAAGTMEKANAIAMDTITGKTKALSASWQELSGNLLSSELIKGVVDFASWVVNGINDINTATGGVIVQFGALVAVVSSLITAFGTLKATAVAAGFASLKASMAALLTPTGLVVAGIAVLVTGLYNIHKAIQSANPSLEELNEKLADANRTCEELNDKLEANEQRLRELYSLDSRTIVEEEELRKLEHENLLLSNQLLIEQKLQAIQQAKVESELIEKYGSGAKKTVTEDTSYSYLSPSNGSPNFVDMTELEHYLWLLKEIPQHEDKITKLTQSLANAKPDTFEYDQIESELEAYEVLYREQLAQAQQYSSQFTAEFSNLPDNVAGELGEIKHQIDKANILFSQSGNLSLSQTAKSLLNISGFQDAKTALDEYYRSGELTATKMAELYQASEEDDALRAYVDTLIEWGTISDTSSASMNKLIEAVYGAKTAIKGSVDAISLSDMIENVSDPLDILREAIDDVANSGYVGIDTLKKISSECPSLEKYLVQTSRGYKVATGAIDDFTEAMQAQYRTAITDAKKAANQIIEDHGKIALAIGVSTDAYISEIKAMIAEKKALIFEANTLGNVGLVSSGIVSTTRSTDGAIVKKTLHPTATYQEATEVSSAYNRTSLVAAWKDDIAQMEAVLSDLATSQSNYDQLMDLLNSPSKTSSSKDDPYKDRLEKEIKILQHKREMDLITDRTYYDELQKIQNKYRVDETKYAEEIWDLEQEIFNGRRELLSDWMNDQQKSAEVYGDAGQLTAQLAIHRGILSEIQKAIDASYAYGLDETSDYVQELRQQAKETSQEILELTKSAFDDFISYADDFDLWNDLDISKVETLEQKLKEIDKLLEDGTLSWKEYIQAHNEAAKDLYDTQKESIETIIDLTMEMIQQEKDDEVEALEDQLEMYEKIIEKKKKMLEKTKDEADHEKEVAELVEDIAELQQKISRLDLDDSREAAAKKQELEKELHEKNKELADLQNDYILDQTIETLDDSLDAKEESIEAETKAIEESIDTWVKKYKLAIERIDDDWDGLYDDLMDYQEEYRDSIDGVDSLQTAWENVESTIESVKATMSGLTGIEDVYENIGNNAINPSTSGSIAANGKSVVMDMYQNSLSALRDPSNWRSYNDENMQIAEQYNASASADQKLFYNSADGTWRIGSTNGALAYKHFGIANDGVARGPVASTMISSEPSGTVKYGDKNNYVKWVQTLLNASIGANLGVDGQFGSATLAAVKQFQAEHGLNNDGVVGTSTIRHLRAYHTGGVVDGTGAINDEEVFAILKRGELVFNDEQKSQLKKILHGMFSMIGTFANFGTSAMKFPATLSPSVGDTFAPKFEINIAHNGSMSDQDARRYGDAIGDAALEKLRVAFSKRGIR